MGAERGGRRGAGGPGRLTARVLGLATPAEEEAAFRSAADSLGRGRLVILPTDTLYALACRAGDAAAVERLRTAKGRDDGKPLPIVAADLEQVAAFAELTPEAERLAASFWPGPLSLVLRARPGLSDAVTSATHSVAVRVPAQEFLRRLCGVAGPLVSTSANRSGAAAPRTCAEAVEGVGAHAELAVDAGPGRLEPSTLVDVTGPEARLLRAGAVAWEAVLRVLRP